MAYISVSPTRFGYRDSLAAAYATGSGAGRTAWPRRTLTILFTRTERSEHRKLTADLRIITPGALDFFLRRTHKQFKVCVALLATIFIDRHAITSLCETLDDWQSLRELLSYLNTLGISSEKLT